jgi:hypothetical protein
MAGLKTTPTSNLLVTRCMGALLYQDDECELASFYWSVPLSFLLKGNRFLLADTRELECLIERTFELNEVF